MIGDSVGGMFPPEPELKQSPRNSACPGTGTFTFRNRTKEVFIYGIKDIFFSWSAQVCWLKSSLDNCILLTEIPPTILTANSSVTRVEIVKSLCLSHTVLQFHLAMAG